MIIGIGVDTVDIERFERQLERTPALRPRLFAEHECALPVPSLAARFAAREALIKALGDSRRLGWHDMAVIRDEDRAPSFAPNEALTRELREVGGERVHLSMSHDGGIATAFVIVEADVSGAASTSSGASANASADVSVDASSVSTASASVEQTAGLADSAESTDFTGGAA